MASDGEGPMMVVTQSIPTSGTMPAAESSDDDSDEDSALEVPAGAEEEGADEDYFERNRSLPAMMWDDDRPEDHGISSTAATFSIITAIIGAGIMALPQLPEKGGIVVPCILMLMAAFATMEAGSSFFRAMMANNIAVQHSIKKTGVFIHSFEDYGYAAAGTLGAMLIRVTVVGWFIGLLSGYVILIGQNLQSVFFRVFNLDYRIWVLIMFPVLWFLSMLRDVSAIAKLMPVGVAAAVGSCIIIIVKSTEDTDVWEEWSPEEIDKLFTTWPPGGFMSLGSLTATIMGALSCMGNVPSIVDEMRNKHNFKMSFRVGVSIVMALYVGIMVLGYQGYGNFIQSNIVTSMTYHPATYEEAFAVPAKDWTGRKTFLLPTVMSCCVIVNLIISYPLNMAPVFISIQGTHYGRKYMKPGSKRNYIMRTVVVAITVAIPLLVTEFSLVFNLFASVCGPIQGVLAPIFFGHAIRSKVGAKGSGPVRLAWHAVLVALAAFCIIFGLIDSIGNLVKSFQ